MDLKLKQKILILICLTLKKLILQDKCMILFMLIRKSNVLRTHTSPVQIRGMLEKKPPIAFISGGKVYRKDDDSNSSSNVSSNRRYLC